MKLPEPYTYFVDRSSGRGFVDSLPQIQRVLRRFEVPFAATLSSGGSLRVLLAAGKWLVPPKEIK